MSYFYVFAYTGVQHILCCVFCFARLHIVCLMLLVSLDCPFLTAPSVFSNIYCVLLQSFFGLKTWSWWCRIVFQMEPFFWPCFFSMINIRIQSKIMKTSWSMKRKIKQWLSSSFPPKLTKRTITFHYKPSSIKRTPHPPLDNWKTPNNYTVTCISKQKKTC